MREPKAVHEFLGGRRQRGGEMGLPVQDCESHKEQALALLQDIQQGNGQVLQPPH